MKRAWTTFRDDFSSLVTKNETRIRNAQDQRSAKEGELQLQGVFLEYTKFSQQSRQWETQETPFRTDMIKKKDGTGSFPAKLDMNVRITALNVIAGVCERTATGWRVLADVSLSNKADFPVKEFLLNNYEDFYAGRYAGVFTIGEFITPDGAIKEKIWVPINERDIVRISASGAEGTLMRKRNPDGSYVVTRRTPVTYFKCEASVHVAGKYKEVHGKGQQWVQEVYLSISCGGGQQVSAWHNPAMPETERLHSMESKDEHMLVPMHILRQRGPAFPSVYFYVCNGYRTPYTSTRGVGLQMICDSESATDFTSVKDGQKVPRHVMRFGFMQWSCDPDNEDGTIEMYTVKLLQAGSDSDMWKCFGILSHDPYVAIMKANLDIPRHVEASLWYNMTVDGAQNAPDVLKTDTWQNCPVSGHYLFGTKSIVPDFPEHFYTRGLQLTAVRVKREFARWAREEDGVPEIVLRSRPELKASPHPLHSQELASSVIALGNGQVEDGERGKKQPIAHAFDGDIYSLFDVCDFYVMTSYMPGDADRVQFYGHAHAALPEECDAHFDMLISTHQVYYWIYAVKRTAMEFVRARKDQEANPAKRAHVEEEEEEPIAPPATPEVPEPAPKSKGRGKKNK